MSGRGRKSALLTRNPNKFHLDGRDSDHTLVLGVANMIRIQVMIVCLAMCGTSAGAQVRGLSSSARSSGQISQEASHKKTVSFSGEVLKGQTYEKQLPASLFFRLVPQDLGWTISIGAKDNPENNFCSVVTPPYRGINAIHIEGWHFRNSDNTGPNQVGAKNVNAPQQRRDFQFVLNSGDYRRAFDALQILLWPYSYSKQQIDQADAVHARLPKGSGTLVIRELRLNALEVGKQAGIDLLKMAVELHLSVR
jgi:hypothetical protein